jgi:hypothetical protein
LVSERWREWQAPISIGHVHQGLWLPDGRVLGEVQLTWPAEMVERFRAGYVCIRCLEPQERAWPERCSLCGYTIRRSQAEFFAHEYGGEVELKTRDWDAELGGLDERRRKEEERAARQDGPLGR